MQYFVQAFGCKKPYPDKYDMLMDIDTEEFIHHEIVEAAIQMLLTSVNCDICFDVLEQNTPLQPKKQLFNNSFFRAISLGYKIFVFADTGLTQMKIYGLKKVVRQTAVSHNKTRPNERNSLTFIVSLRL